MSWHWFDAIVNGGEAVVFYVVIVGVAVLLGAWALDRRAHLARTRRHRAMARHLRADRECGRDWQYVEIDHEEMWSRQT